MAGCPTGASSLYFDCLVPAADHADSGQRYLGVAGIESGPRTSGGVGGVQFRRSTGDSAC